MPRQHRSVWTVGHSTRPSAALIEMLRGERIDLLLDVRTFPGSRRNPQFNREALSHELAGAGIGYRHEPRLGGRRRPSEDSVNTAWRNPGFRGYADFMQTPEFAARIDELIALAVGARVALMCAEALPWRCHRSLIADALTARGVEVRHIVGSGSTRPHRMTPFARVDGERVSYPGLFGVKPPPRSSAG